MFKKAKENKKGFTLAELLIVQLWGNWDGKGRVGCD